MTVNMNMQSSDMVLNHQQFVLKLQKFSEEVPNYWGVVPNHCDGGKERQHDYPVSYVYAADEG